MKIVKPTPMAVEKLVSSSVPEDDAPAWVSTASYSLGSEVVHKNRVWEALTEVPAGVEPGNETVTVESPAKWLNREATNRWKMFDDKVGSQTKGQGIIEVSIVPGEVVNAIALFNVDARSVTVRMIDSYEGEVYRRTVILVDTGADDWYGWFFDPMPKRRELVLLDLPAYGTATIIVEIENLVGEAAVGHFVLGTQSDIGVAQYGTSVGITDFSRKERDDYGNPILIRRAFSKRAEFDVWLETRRVSAIQRLLASLRSEPTVWIGEQKFEETIIFGFYRDFDITISGPTVSDATITVEGMV